ncbi:MAG TPA: hypothetical protein VD731_01055 [Nitrosopumilaceae archaeon]|nr:hypothetical protein [Nitrosopumilaceae archaeon]
MPRWDDEGNFKHNTGEKTQDYEELRLLKKFEDYRELEKKELRIVQNKEKSHNWTNRFVFLTIIQSFIIAGFTTSLLLMEFINLGIKVLVAVLTIVVLGGGIIFIYKYLQKKSHKISQKNMEHSKIETEFDLI